MIHWWVFAREMRAILLFLFLLGASPLFGEVRKVYRDDGALLERISDDEREQFVYDEEGRLVQVKVSDNKGLSSLTFFAYDLYSGNLSLVQEGSRVSFFFPDGFSIGDDVSFEQFGKMQGSYYVRSNIKGGVDHQLQSSLALDDEGNFVHSRFEGGFEYEECYDAKGNLISLRVSEGELLVQLTENVYDEEGVLLSQNVTYQDGRKETRFYEKGVLSSLVEISHDLVEKETIFSPVKVETVYDKGFPYARITYGENGVGVKNVEYL